MSQQLSRLLQVLLLLYPVIALGAIKLAGPYAALAVVAAFLALRLLVPAPSALSRIFLPAIMMAAVLILTLGAIAPEAGVRFYPVLMNLAMLATFVHTLWRPPSMIERFARIVEPNLDDAGVCYTRKVTVVWIGFFVINGAIALATAIAGTWTQWALYNGFISYVLVGALCLGEYWVRSRIVHAAE